VSDPRPYTTDEMREMFLGHVRAMVDYWAHPDREENMGEPQTTHRRMSGLAFSLLVMLDGGAGDLPAFVVTPNPHPEDEPYFRSAGENWWVGESIANAQLHELHDDFYNNPEGKAWRAREGR
jgi:hypothetical protein